MRFLLFVLLGYVTLGVLFAILSFLGIPSVSQSMSLRERLKISALAILIWPYAVKEGTVELIDYIKYKFRSSK